MQTRHLRRSKKISFLSAGWEGHKMRPTGRIVFIYMISLAGLKPSPKRSVSSCVGRCFPDTFPPRAFVRPRFVRS